jgi:hypothetical protein
MNLKSSNTTTTDMTKANSCFKKVAYIFGFISMFLLLFSLITGLRYDSSASFPDSIQNIYKAISTYSEFHKFTFIVFAFSVALRQLEISQNNYNTTLEQVKFVQDDIIEKRKKEEKDETLKHCNFFMTEFQILYKELFEKKIFDEMPIVWSNLDTFTSSSLEHRYPTLYQKINNFERPKKNEVLITLYKLEGFSTTFLHAKIDKSLGKDIIGFTYSNQIGLLMGLISFFRTDSEDIFGHNTIKLYKEWKESDVEWAPEPSLQIGSEPSVKTISNQ